ncbi:aspartate aminotransferase [Xylariaceae sp. FL1651]|nr:aspartate aminotransferase [Xylariaceae sp. FL1651]
MPGKVSLGAGVYRDDNGESWTLPSGKQAIPLLPDNHDYLPQTGLAPFLSAARKLLMGELSDDLDERLTSIQTISGIGACHVGAVFFINSMKLRNVWISDPSWINHSVTWECVDSGVTRKFYPYYHAKARSFDFEGEAQKGDVLILQACAHNPTGLDPSKAQWSIIVDIYEKKSLVPFFDTAYQGFAAGDVDEDAWAIRPFTSRGTLEFGIAQSFPKNFGLYGERVGAFHLPAKDAAVKAAVQSQLVRIVRSEVSCSPAFGARIVATVLNNPQLRRQWGEYTEGNGFADKSHANAGPVGHLVSQVGMFSYTGLSREQVRGRVSIPGLTTQNVMRVAAAMDTVVRNTSNS